MISKIFKHFIIFLIVYAIITISFIFTIDYLCKEPNEGHCCCGMFPLKGILYLSIFFLFFLLFGAIIMFAINCRDLYIENFEKCKYEKELKQITIKKFKKIESDNKKGEQEK